MSNEQIIISVTVFFAAICFMLVIRGFTSDAPERDARQKRPALFNILSGGIYFFSSEAGKLLEGMLPKKTDELEDLIKKADFSLSAADIYGAQIFMSILGGIIGAAMVYAMPEDMSGAVITMCIVIFAVVGFIFPEMTIRKEAEQRADEILHHLPFAIDLISSSMNAGLDFGAAVRYLISSGKEDALRREFSIFLRDMELGKTRTDALLDMKKRINISEFSRFVSAITYGMDSGSSIIDIMRIQAEEMRRVKYARAEQQAAKAPAKMIIPMAIFIFPSMFIIIFTPIFLNMREAGVLSLVGK